MLFPQQFFAVSSPLPEGRVILAGGLDPLRGSRSAYRASVACYDYAAEKIVWLQESVKSYPFRAVTHTSGACAVLLPQNFVRCPTGMFRFDLESGEPLPPDAEVAGWKITSVEATADSFYFSWVHNATSFLRAVSARGAASRERSFPYHSTSGGKTIERVVDAGPETVVAVFSLVDGKRVVYSLEQWTMDSATYGWQRRTSLKNVVRNGSDLMVWGCSGSNLDVEILSLATGELRTAFRLPLADVVAIQPIDADSYAVLSFTGAYIIDAISKSVSRELRPGPSEFLDFGALAVDASRGKLIVVTAGNYQRPGTCLSVCDL